MYLPKSKYITRNTAGNEFQTRRSTVPYVGPYFETSTGKFFTGSSPSSTSEELFRLAEQGDSVGRIQSGPEAVNYTDYDFIRRDDMELELRSTIPVPLHYPKPGNGESFTRYFAIEKTTQRVVELSKSTYLSMESEETKYYFPKYDLRVLEWSLTNASENRINAAIEGLESYLKDPSQFVR